MRFRVIGRDEQTETEVVREIVCDTPDDAEAVAVFEGILVSWIEQISDSPEPPRSADAGRAPPLTTSSTETARGVEANRPPEFGGAPLAGLPAPLSDPLRALRSFLGWLMLVQIALAVCLLISQAYNDTTLVLSAGSILLTFAFWRVLPNRPVNAFYLRSFRHDADTWAMRRTLAAALGRSFRLSGIRDPRRRPIKLLRYLTVFLFALRYLTPKYMNLEAGAGWKRRLWRSLGDARLAVIDVSDLTPFVAEEIRLCARCLGLNRILFIGSAGKDAEACKAEINQVLDRPPDRGEVHLAVWRPSSLSGRPAFEGEVHRFVAQVPAEPAGLRHDAFPLSLSPAPGLWTWLTTPLDLSEGWVWGELLLGLALAGGLWVVSRKQLFGMTARLTHSDLRDLWFLPVLVISVLGLALCELWHLLLYLKDCGAFRERCLTLATFGLPLVAPLYVAVEKVRESAARTQCASHLKQLAIVMNNYADAHADTFPGAAICDPRGKPLLSWRVAILPYLEQDAPDTPGKKGPPEPAELDEPGDVPEQPFDERWERLHKRSLVKLYKEFHLDEPWDSPHNLPLVERMPKVYAVPWASRKTPPGHTYYRVFVSPPSAQPRAVFLNGLPTRRGLFSHGPSQPILIVEAADAVPWTKPDELTYDPNGPLPKLGGHFSGGFLAVRTNGFVMFVPSATPEATLQGLIGTDLGQGILDR